MIDPKRTSGRGPIAHLADPPTPAGGELVIFPADRIVRPAAAMHEDDPRVRVEYRGKVKVYRDRDHLAAELNPPPGPAVQLVRLAFWGLVLAGVYAMGLGFGAGVFG